MGKVALCSLLLFLSWFFTGCSLLTFFGSQISNSVYTVIGIIEWSPEIIRNSFSLSTDGSLQNEWYVIFVLIVPCSELFFILLLQFVVPCFMQLGLFHWYCNLCSVFSLCPGKGGYSFCVKNKSFDKINVYILKSLQYIFQNQKEIFKPVLTIFICIQLVSNSSPWEISQKSCWYVLSFSKYSIAILMRPWQIRRKWMSIQRFIEEGTICNTH